MKRYIYAIIVFSLLGMSLKAQQPKKDEYNESVVIKTTFSPVVNEAYKLTSKPTVLDSTFELPAFKYDKTGKQFPTFMTFDKIKPANVKDERTENLYNAHIKAGIGTYFTSLLEASYSQTRSKDLVYSADFKHRSSLGQIKDYAHSTYAENDLRLYAKKIWTDFSLDANIFYEHQRYYYYGFSDTIDKAKSDYRTTYRTIGTRLNYRSLYRDESMFHNFASFAFRHTSGEWGYGETDINFTAGVRKELSLFNNQTQYLGLQVNYNQIAGSYSAKDLTPFFDPTLKLEDYKNRQGIVDIHAYMDFAINRFNIHAALSLAPCFGNHGKFYFLPDIIASLPDLTEHIGVEGGLKSETELPTLNAMVRENPYISPLVQTKLQSYTSLFAKAVYSGSNNLHAELEVGLAALQNKYFYTLDTNAALHNMFSIVYDKAKRLYVDLCLDYKLKDITLKANVVFQNVKTEDLDKAWYIPAFKAGMSVEYSADKLTIALVPSFASSVKCLNEKREVVKLKSRFDLSLNASYKYSDQWSFFVELDNLAFQRYYNYYNYPAQRFVGIIGARYAF